MIATWEVDLYKNTFLANGNFFISITNHCNYLCTQDYEIEKFAFFERVIKTRALVKGITY